jgi:hypothetical protein
MLSPILTDSAKDFEGPCRAINAVILRCAVISHCRNHCGIKREGNDTERLQCPSADPAPRNVLEPFRVLPRMRTGSVRGDVFIYHDMMSVPLCALIELPQWLRRITEAGVAGGRSPKKR